MTLTIPPPPKRHILDGPGFATPYGGRLAEADTPSVEEAIARAREVEKTVYDLTTKQVKEMGRLLIRARIDTMEAMARATKEWRQSDRAAVLASLTAALARFEQNAGTGLVTVQRAGFEAGADFPENLGISLSTLPTIDPTVLQVAIATTPDLITNVSQETKRKIATLLRMGALGQKSPLDLIKQMGTVAGKGVWANAFARGEAIYRTEAGRMFSTGTFLRQRQLEETNPGWLKEWHSVHDSRTRFDHVIADGQRVKVNEFFTVGGYKALYPHDPNLPAAQSVHCRCVSITIRPEWSEKGGPRDEAREARRVSKDIRAEIERAMKPGPLNPRLESALKSLGQIAIDQTTGSAYTDPLKDAVAEMTARIEEIDAALADAEAGTDEFFALREERNRLTEIIDRINATLATMRARRYYGTVIKPVVGAESEEES